MDEVLGMLGRFDRISAAVGRDSLPWCSVGIVVVQDKRMLLSAGRHVGQGQDRKRCRTRTQGGR